MTSRPYGDWMWPTVNPFAESAPLPGSWSPGEQQVLARLHDRWACHRDLLTPAELARCRFLVYLLTEGRIRRG
jgi:hypothetical protein